MFNSTAVMSYHSAVVESRRIFRKLKSYVTYRFAASMQIVIVLTLLIYISNCPIDSVSIHTIYAAIVTPGQSTFILMLSATRNL